MICCLLHSIRLSLLEDEMEEEVLMGDGVGLEEDRKHVGSTPFVRHTDVFNTTEDLNILVFLIQEYAK